MLKDLKLDNDTISRAAVLTEWVQREIPEDKVEIRRIMSTMEPELFDDLLVLKASMEDEAMGAGNGAEVSGCAESGRDCAESGRDYVESGRDCAGSSRDGAESSRKSQDKIRRLMELTEEIRRDGDCTCLKELAVTGKDLLEHGMKPGKQVGAVLSELLEVVLEHPEQNQKEILLSIVFPPAGVGDA